MESISLIENLARSGSMSDIAILRQLSEVTLSLRHHGRFPTVVITIEAPGQVQQFKDCNPVNLSPVSFIVEAGGRLNDMRRGLYAYRKRFAGLVFRVGADQEIRDNLVVKILHQRFDVRRKIVRPDNV